MYVSHSVSELIGVFEQRINEARPSAQAPTTDSARRLAQQEELQTHGILGNKHGHGAMEVTVVTAASSDGEEMEGLDGDCYAFMGEDTAGNASAVGLPAITDALEGLPEPENESTVAAE
jgi:hypothetical protein